MSPEPFTDKNLPERRRRMTALAVLGFMMLLFVVLSGFSFLGSRSQVLPEDFSYANDHNAVDGKRIWQAYNCMGCHTIVGNGAYFGPDLTNIYQDAGPAYLAAYMPSAGTWPTEAALRTQLQNPNQLADTGISDINEYYAYFPGALERVERRGGDSTFMPNLQFKADEVDKLIAFFKYTSAMDNEGWPPVPKIDGLQHPVAAPVKNILASAAPASTATGTAADSASGSPTASVDPTAIGPAVGAGLVADYGCLACHSTGSDRLVGPGWGKLYGSTAAIEGGTTATVDEAYLQEAILYPNEKIAAGYPANVMPAYAGVLSDDELTAMVAYIRSLEAQ